MPIGSIAARGSHVPHRRLNRTRATFMPDTAWPGPQAPARLIPGQATDPGADADCTLSALQQWFTRVRLLGSHLTHHVRLFPQCSPPRLIHRSSPRRFRTSPCMSGPGGPTPSPVQHHNQRHDPLHRNPQLCSWRTDLRVLRCLAPAKQDQPAEHPDRDQIQQTRRHEPRSCPSPPNLPTRSSETCIEL